MPVFVAGAALGLLASQIGNVTMSSVGVERSSEIGGLQGIFQNLGSSLGTALIGSVLIASLSSSFLGAVDSSDLPSNVKDLVAAQTQAGVNIVPVSTVDDIATQAGLSPGDAATLTTLYADSQVSSLRASMVALVFIGSLSLLFSKNIPTALVRRKPTEARISAQGEKDGAPLVIQGKSPLQAVSYPLPMASAQVKGCVLLAGLFADAGLLSRFCSSDSSRAASAARAGTASSMAF